MSTVKSKKLQVGTDATASNNFTIYQPSTPDGTLRIGVGNADSPTEVGKFNSNGYVATNAPAFSAYQSSAQSLTANTTTKIQFQTEEFDTASCFDNSTNYRFTPNVAGYYQINANINFTSSRTYTVLSIYRNGVSNKISNNGNGTTALGCSISALIYFNGSTDYIELYVLNGISQNVNTGANQTYFQAFLARAV